MTRRETGPACLLLALATAFVFRGWLFAARTLYWGDFGLYFFPMFRFLRDELRRGTFPLWNPWIMSGTPFVGNPQVWPLYPGILLLPWLPASAYLTVSCAVHSLLAGLFFFLFLRRGRLDLSFWPSLLGAVAYAFGGYFVTKAQYPNMLQALAYVPLVLLLVERLAAVPRCGVALTLGTTLGLQLLAAHAQVTAYTLYLGVFYGVFCVWMRTERTWRGIGGVAGHGLLAGVVALALSCGQWLPTLAAQRLAARQALPLADANRLHLSWGELSNFALPFHYGSPLRGDYVGPGAFWETACYAGTLTLVLAVVGFVTSLRADWRRETLFWLVIFAGSVWLALGVGGGLFPLVFASVPGMKLFHDPARFLLGASVALSLLAALGLQALTALLAGRVPERGTAWIGAAVVLLTVLDLARFVGGVYPLKPVREIENLAALSPVARSLSSDPSLASGEGRILVIDSENADNALLPWTRFGQTDPKQLPRLTDALLPNLPMAVGLRDSSGYEPLVLRDAGIWALLATELAQAQGRDQPPRPDLAAQVAPLLGTLGVRAVIAYRPQPLRSVPGMTPRFYWPDGVNNGFVYANEQFLPRARLYSSWQTVDTVSPSEMVETALRAGRDTTAWRSPWVEGDVPPTLPPLGRPQPPLSAAFALDRPDRIGITVPAVSNAGLLVLADTAFPGWSATLDGRPAPVLRADAVYRAVYVPASSDAPHRVEFRYRPEPFVLGLYMTGLTLAVLVSYRTFLWRRRCL